ncbi:MAG: dihydrofolate reductase [Anaerolineaceae bacterium]|nr:dihydrofolate reductase [Anaerolineaceae bacterium]
MRKIVFLIHMSLDGYVADRNGGIDWIAFTDELANLADNLSGQMDAALYGRNTYQMMADYWPTAGQGPDADAHDRNHAQWFRQATKVVVSDTLESAEWADVIIKGDELTERINQLKAQSGKDIWLLGSPTLSQSLMRLNLIDEYIFTVSPVILGGGSALFPELDVSRGLKLVENRVTNAGALILKYVPTTE